MNNNEPVSLGMISESNMLPGIHNNIHEVLARHRRWTTRLMYAAAVTFSVGLGLITHSIYQLCQ